MYTARHAAAWKFEMAPATSCRQASLSRNSRWARARCLCSRCFTAWCRNGLIVADRALRKTHVGPFAHRTTMKA